MKVMKLLLYSILLYILVYLLPFILISANENLIIKYTDYLIRLITKFKEYKNQYNDKK